MLKKPVRICDECGTENTSQERKCKQCGEDISDIIPTISQKQNNKLFTYELRVVDGSLSVSIDKTVLVIGREADLKEYLGKKMFVSRHHAELTIVAGKVFIKNLSNTNKTYINNEEISNDKPHPLMNGDEIVWEARLFPETRQDHAAYFLFMEQL